MDVAKILSELKEERVQIEEAILSLERLARGRGKRRGRPPAWMSEINAKRRGRPPGSKNKAAVEAAVAPAKTIAVA
jgi:DNA invertase Pin-like site-specific DNA recombinase